MMFPGKSLVILALTGLASYLPAAPPEGVGPFISQYCFQCHDAETAEGGIDLEPLIAAKPGAELFDQLADVQDVVVFEEMPPAKKGGHQPTTAEREAFAAQIEAWRDQLSRTNAGAPGPVTVRRLTNPEYHYSLLDLTGLDLGLTERFIPDSGGGEGFFNTGDTLFMSAQHLEQYLDAATTVAGHATILPGQGIRFHPHPIGERGLEQTRNTIEQSLRIAIRKHALPLLPGAKEPRREADYLRACWQYRFRDQTGAGDLSTLAEAAGLRPWVLKNWWAFLERRDDHSKLLPLIWEPFWELPGPDGSQPDQVPFVAEKTFHEIEARLQDWYQPRKGERRAGWSIQRRQRLVNDENWVGLQCRPEGAESVAFVVGDFADGQRGDLLQLKPVTYMTAESAAGETPEERFLSYDDWLQERIIALEKAVAAEEDPDPNYPSAEGQELRRLQATASRLTALQQSSGEFYSLQAPAILRLPVPPEAEVMALRCRLDDTLDDREEASVQVWFDPGPAPDPSRVIPAALILANRDTRAHREIGWWHVSGLNSAFPYNQETMKSELEENLARQQSGHTGVYYFSRAQCLDLLDETARTELAPHFLDAALHSAESLTSEQAAEWDTRLISHLEAFARRAWRRPLTVEEKQRVANLYHAEQAAGRGRESAARETVAGILSSAQFLYLLEPGTVTGTGEVPLTDHELAARLAATLWVSLPDDALLAAADSGSLREPAEVEAQIRRMLANPKAARFARVFGGQWLHLHEFGGKANVDREQFPAFTDELHAAMTDELEHFLSTLVRENRPVTDLLWADYSFLNPVLADFYGVNGFQPDEGFQEVALSDHHRGGLLGMGAVLTHTSYPNRTSPVRRGHWLLEVILGDPPPAPPPNIPPLESAAVESQNPSVREMLEAHRADPACASCHNKIDPLGIAMENFDAIGRWQSDDPIASRTTLANGEELEGVAGLKQYLAGKKSAFLEHFCRKLLGYMLGRQVLPSDSDLIETMMDRLAANDYAFDEAVLAIAESRQFQNKSKASPKASP